MPLLNSSAPISLANTTTGQSVAQELLNIFDSTGLSSTSTISFNDQRVRQVAGKTAYANQPVTMPTDFLGKTATFPHFYGTLSPTGSKIRVYSFGYFYASQGSYVNGTNGAGLQFNDTGYVGSGTGTTSSVYTTGSIGVYADAYPNSLYIPQYWKWSVGTTTDASYYLMRVNFSSYSGPSGMLLQIGNSVSYENVTLGTTSNEYYLSSNPFVRWVSNPTYPSVVNQTGTYTATGTIYIKNTANASTGYARLEESITFSFSTYWEYVNDGDYGGGGG
jgi:hypothetical protein